MRVVLRVLFAEFSLAWALMLAGSVRAAVQIWPFLVEALGARWPRRWRVRTGFAVGAAIAAGWPLLFSLTQAQDGYQGWLWAIAVPWWILLAVYGLRILLARAWDV